MTLYEYNALDDNEKEQVFLEEGIYVTDRFEGEYHIHLYHVFSFYVEEYCHKQGGYVEKDRSFSSTDCLDVYLQKIDLKDIAYLFIRR